MWSGSFVVERCVNVGAVAQKGESAIGRVHVHEIERRRPFLGLIYSLASRFGRLSRVRLHVVHVVERVVRHVRHKNAKTLVVAVLAGEHERSLSLASGMVNCRPCLEQSKIHRSQHERRPSVAGSLANSVDKRLLQVRRGGAGEAQATGSCAKIDHPIDQVRVTIDARKVQRHAVHDAPLRNRFVYSEHVSHQARAKEEVVANFVHGRVMEHCDLAYFLQESGMCEAY